MSENKTKSEIYINDSLVYGEISVREEWDKASLTYSVNALMQADLYIQGGMDQTYQIKVDNRFVLKNAYITGINCSSKDGDYLYEILAVSIEYLGARLEV